MWEAVEEDKPLRPAFKGEGGVLLPGHKAVSFALALPWTQRQRARGQESSDAKDRQCKA